MTAGKAQHAIDRANDVVVEVLQTLLRFDTTCADHAEPARDDAALQRFVADYLAGLGAEVELFEPDPSEIDGHPRRPANLSFAGRPILVAKFPGAGSGRSLLVNGHYDTVPPGPLGEWRFSPWEGAVQDGRVYGRGACDMKGGIATGLAVLHGLVGAGIRLEGDVYFNTVPFEEVSGMGTVATVRRGYRPDGAIALEPSGIEAPLTAYRGLLIAELLVEGRSAHAEMTPPAEGGGVNAVDKLVDVLGALRALNEQWAVRPDKQHASLTTPQALTTMVEGGDFPYTFPGSAQATLSIPYLPAEADADGYGGRVRAEIERTVADVASADAWLREHPPVVRWVNDLPPMELAHDEPLVLALVEAAAKHGHVATSTPSDIWADMATFTIEGGVPSISWGGGSDGQAHTVDEYIEISELHAAIPVLVDLILTWTGSNEADGLGED